MNNNDKSQKENPTKDKKKRKRNTTISLIISIILLILLLLARCSMDKLQGDYEHIDDVNSTLTSSQISSDNEEKEDNSNDENNSSLQEDTKDNSSKPNENSSANQKEETPKKETTVSKEPVVSNKPEEPKEEHTHTVSILPKEKPTCTLSGLTEGKYCSVCKETLIKQEEIKALGHSYESKTIAATCEEVGYIIKTCSRCEDTITTSIAPLGHTEVIDEKIKPTCLEKGYEEGKHCDVCGKVLVKQEEIAALGHKTIVCNAKEPSCKEEGYTGDTYCEREDCKKLLGKGDVISKISHTEVILSAVSPSCTETGLTEGKYCTTCETITVSQTVVSKLGHSLGDSFVSVEPKCLTEGESKKECQRDGCNYFETQTIDFLGHDIIIDNAVLPNCEETGLTQGEHCSRCDYKIEQETVSSLGHTPILINKKDPDCENNGYTGDTVCDDCNKPISMGATIPKLNHPNISYTQILLDEEKHNIFCNTCETNIGTENHTIVNEVCTKCNMFICSHSNMRYENQGAENGHNVVCADCDDILTRNQNHSDFYYDSVNDYIHEIYCGKCREVIGDEYHNFVNGKCDKCDKQAPLNTYTQDILGATFYQYYYNTYDINNITIEPTLPNGYVAEYTIRQMVITGNASNYFDNNTWSYIIPNDDFRNFAEKYFKITDDIWSDIQTVNEDGDDCSIKYENGNFIIIPISRSNSDKYSETFNSVSQNGDEIIINCTVYTKVIIENPYNLFNESDYGSYDEYDAVVQQYITDNGISYNGMDDYYYKNDALFDYIITCEVEDLGEVSINNNTLTYTASNETFKIVSINMDCGELLATYLIQRDAFNRCHCSDETLTLTYKDKNNDTYSIDVMTAVMNNGIKVDVYSNTSLVYVYGYGNGITHKGKFMDKSGIITSSKSNGTITSTHTFDDIRINTSLNVTCGNEDVEFTFLVNDGSILESVDTSTATYINAEGISFPLEIIDTYGNGYDFKGYCCVIPDNTTGIFIIKDKNGNTLIEQSGSFIGRWNTIEIN